jgi:hypothetical protein
MFGFVLKTRYDSDRPAGGQDVDKPLAPLVK